MKLRNNKEAQELLFDMWRKYYANLGKSKRVKKNSNKNKEKK